MPQSAVWHQAKETAAADTTTPCNTPKSRHGTKPLTPARCQVCTHSRMQLICVWLQGKMTQAVIHALLLRHKTTCASRAESTWQMLPSLDHTEPWQNPTTPLGCHTPPPGPTVVHQSKQNCTHNHTPWPTVVSRWPSCMIVCAVLLSLCIASSAG